MTMIDFMAPQALVGVMTSVVVVAAAVLAWRGIGMRRRAKAKAAGAAGDVEKTKE